MAYELGNRAGNNRFESIKQTNQIEFPSSSICLTVCKAGASSACLVVTKLALRAVIRCAISLNNLLTY